MSFLESLEREALTLRFVEEWEYHEIAAAKAVPIGTVQWRVFNAKKKLATYLLETARSTGSSSRRSDTRHIKKEARHEDSHNR